MKLNAFQKVVDSHVLYPVGLLLVGILAFGLGVLIGLILV
jgi:hypothetical protein